MKYIKQKLTKEVLQKMRDETNNRKKFRFLKETLQTIMEYAVWGYSSVKIRDTEFILDDNTLICAFKKRGINVTRINNDYPSRCLISWE